MSRDIRRLVFDINPWVWVYIAVMAVFAAFLDWLWLGDDRQRLLPLMPGLFLSFGSAFAAQKVPLWRTLPVSRAEIDRARWWQSIAGPALLLFLLMFAGALVLDRFGNLHTPWRTAALVWLAQFGVSVALICTQNILFPLASRRMGRSAVVLLIPFVVAIVRMNLVTGAQTDLQSLLYGLAAFGLAGAAALYLSAGHWPSPLTTALWSVTPTNRAPLHEVEKKTHRPRGWPALIPAVLPMLGLVFAAMAGIPVILKWMLPRLDLSAAGWMMALIAMPVALTMLGMAMRALRALPLSGARLTGILVLILLLIQAAALAMFNVALWLMGESFWPFALSAGFLFLPLFFFPLALHFGMRVMQFCYALSLVALLPLQFLGPDLAAAPWLMAMLAILSATCIAWMRWEITHGHRAYRVQTLVPARWRGF